MEVVPPEPKPRKYTWPWFLLAGVVLGIVLAVVAVVREVNRVKNYQADDPLYRKSDAPADTVK